MKIRTLLMLVVLVVLSCFVALNWSAFMAPTILSVGLTHVEAPLGLVMLGLMLALTAMFLAFVVYLQTSVLFDARHHARELRTNRELADKAEASRFTELRGFIESELHKLNLRDEAAQAVTLNRIEQVDRDFRAALKRSENTLAAQIAQQTPRQS